ncbi:MAG: hypothetical protein ACKOAU_14125, partial [Pirellula sp.]
RTDRTDRSCLTGIAERITGFLQHATRVGGTFLRGTVRLDASLHLLAPVILQNACAGAILDSL